MQVAQFLGNRTIREAALALGASLALSGIGAAAEPARPVTFAKDVAPILRQKCQECHQPGSIAPMSLRTYEETRPWATSIKDRVMRRQMPPGVSTRVSPVTQGLEARIGPERGQVCHSLMVSSYCTPGSAQRQAAKQI